MCRLSFIISLSVISFVGIAQQTLSLHDCIEMAWANNLQIKQSELGVDAGESDLQSSRANVLPNVNGFATHNYNWGQRIDPFTNQFANARVQSNSIGVSSSITLFNGFQTMQDIRSQQAGLEASRYDLEVQKNNIALAVTSSFLQILLIGELIITAEQQVAITAKQLERVKKLVEAGAANLGTQYELEAQLGRDKSILIQRRNDQAIARLQLNQMMLIPAEEVITLIKPSLEADSTLRLESSTTVYAYAETSMPEIKSARYSLLSREQQLGIARSNYYPSLTLSGSIGTGYSGLRTNVISATPVNEEIGFTQSGESVFTQTYDVTLGPVPFSTQLSDNFNQFIGVSLNVPIFNRWDVKNTVTQARINRSMAELRLEQEKQDLRQRIESARADALAARELYKANIGTLKSAQKAFEFAEARFEAGALNVTDFNNSKNNLQIAQAEVSRTLYDFIFKTRVLDFYMGSALGFDQ